jgi:hypothetical protein
MKAFQGFLTFISFFFCFLIFPFGFLSQGRGLRGENRNQKRDLNLKELAFKGPFFIRILKKGVFQKKFEAGEELNQLTFSGCSPPALN